MRKLIVLGIVVTMVMGLAVAASAAFVQDTEWNVFFSLNNGVRNTITSQYGAAGADVKVGNNPVPGTVSGSTFATSTIAVVRDMSSAGAGFGLTSNLKTALVQTAVVQTQEWTNIELWANSGFVSPSLKLMMWGTLIDGNGPDSPALSLVCTQAVAGSGFTVNQVVFNSLANSTKIAPGQTIDLTPYIATYKTGSSGSPIATFKLVATTPALPVITPEPGSMVALFSGLVGLLGFGIRRRK